MKELLVGVGNRQKNEAEIAVRVVCVASAIASFHNSGRQPINGVAGLAPRKSLASGE